MDTGRLAIGMPEVCRQELNRYVASLGPTRRGGINMTTQFVQ